MPESALNYVAEPHSYLERAKAYGSCVGGRRYAVTHQTPGTTVTGQTSFVATTPTFLINQTDAAHRVVLSNFALCQSGAAGDVLNILVAIDTADRYSSGGTAIVPQATAAPSLVSAGFSFRYNLTASAAGAGTRYLYHWTQPVWPGAIFNPDLHDGLLIGLTGSILIYSWAATTAPTWLLGGFDVMEDE